MHDPNLLQEQEQLSLYQSII